MALTLLEYPDACLNLAGDCLNIGFSTDNLLESAYIAWDIGIDTADLVDVQEGSYLIVAGVKFTFTLGAADLPNNVILGTIAGIEAGFAANHYINYNFDHSIVTTKATISPKVRSFDISATLGNLDASPNSKNISTIPTPVKARDAFGALTSMVYKGSLEVLFLAVIPTEFETDYAQENILAPSVVIEKDFGELLDGYLNTLLPSVPTAHLEITNIVDIAKEFTFNASEAWGTPTNVYGSPFSVLGGQDILIAKGKSILGETLTDYCGETLYGCSPTIMACDQILYFSYYHETAGDTTLSFLIKYYDAQNNLLLNTNISAVGDPNTFVWTVAVKMSVVSGAFTAPAVKLEITPIAGGSIKSRYNVTIINERSETLIYKSSKCVYNSIPVQLLNTAEFENTTEFITKCAPCSGDTSAIIKQAINSQRYKTVSFDFWNMDRYSECELEEFFSSEEVYWVVGNELYFIEPSTGLANVFNRGETSNPRFTGKIKLT